MNTVATKIQSALQGCKSVDSIIALLSKGSIRMPTPVSKNAEIDNLQEEIKAKDAVINAKDAKIKELETIIAKFMQEAEDARARARTGNGAEQNMRHDQGGAGGSEPSRYGHGQATGAVDDGPNRTRGNPVKLKIPKHDDLDTQYEIVELSEVQASHLPGQGFQVNDKYGLENERQYQTEKPSQEKVMRNAQNLDPDYLVFPSIDANQGAPVVDHLGNVLGGNSRTMSIGFAYDKFPEKAQAYKQALIDRATDFGIDGRKVAAMQRPILIRRVTAELAKNVRQDLISALNEDFKATRERKAEGKSRGMRFSKNTLSSFAHYMRETEATSLREFFDSEKSKDIIDMMVQDGVLSETEMNSFLAVDGKLNPEGKRVVEESLRGRLVDRYETLNRLGAKTLERIERALPNILFLEAVGGKWSITSYIKEALQMAADYTSSAKNDSKSASTSKFLDQVKLDGKTWREEYKRKSVTIFECLINDKADKAFMNRVAKLASDARISSNSPFPGMAKDPKEAFIEAFKKEESKGLGKQVSAM